MPKSSLKRNTYFFPLGDAIHPSRVVRHKQPQPSSAFATRSSDFSWISGLFGVFGDA